MAGLVLATSPALAQRADENVTTSAEDGFGKSVGNESVGVYANGQVRGFSAYDAGNARIEGLYYNESGGITDLLQSGSDIRVGLSAFGQPFTAPTGIVDTQLRRVTSDRTIVSVRVNSGDYFSPDASIEAAIPVADNFGINTALGYFDEQYPDGAGAWFISYGAVARYRPAKDIELTALYSRYDYGDEEMGPTIFSAGAFLPKRIERCIFFGQQWGEWSGHAQNIGGLAKTKFGDWRIEAGLFNSRFTQDDFASAWYDDVNAAGIGRRYILSGQDQRFASTSGEVRVIRSIKDNKRLHRFIVSLRGRNVEAEFGGYDLADLGLGEIGVPDAEPEPVRNYGPLTRDIVKQRSLSAGYELIWQGVGELNIGLTRSDYRKNVVEPGMGPFSRRDRDWLWNAALAIPIGRNLTVYGATTRGLEESGTAPGNAANANNVLPALRTKQIEAGLRYRLSDKVRSAGAWFDLRKPYFEIDQTDNVYRILGEVRHRGVEMSLSGEVTTGVSLVAGAVFLDPVVTSEAVDDGRLGRRPIGRTRTLVDTSVDWTPAGQNVVSLDMRILYEGSRTADTLNRFSIPARATIDLGGRYRFKLGKSPATLRVKLANATNVYGWRVFGGGGFKTNAPRRLTASITADF
jgi:iron complex outermembrane recepter protein